MPRPTTPPPSVAWNPDAEGFTAGELTVTGLPAIAADGAAVMLAIHETYDGPDMPNLALVERGRDDHEVGKLVVMSVEEANAEGAKPKDLPGANHWLDARHQARDWRAPSAFAEVAHDENSGTSTSLGDVAVAWTEGHLTVTQAGAKVVDGTHPDWLATPHPICASPVPECQEPCENPSELASVVGDLAHHLLIVTISYQGTDSCWEPPPQSHVVTW